MSKTIEISEETFEKIKGQLQDEEYGYYDNYVLVRSYSAGCFAGILAELDKKNRAVKLSNCRRLWYWDGAATLSQIAMEGVKKPENCKFPQEVENQIIFEICEIIDCTKEAQKNIREVWIWKK